MLLLNTYYNSHKDECPLRVNSTNKIHTTWQPCAYGKRDKCKMAGKNTTLNKYCETWKVSPFHGKSKANVGMIAGCDTVTSIYIFRSPRSSVNNLYKWLKDGIDPTSCTVNCQICSILRRKPYLWRSFMLRHQLPPTKTGRESRQSLSQSSLGSSRKTHLTIQTTISSL